MIKILSILSIIITIGCNQSNNKNDTQIKRDTLLYYRHLDIYPKEINTLRLQKLFDTARWYLYCIHSDDTASLKNNPINSVTKNYGSLDLRFDQIEDKKDTLEFYFSFYDTNIRYSLETVSNLKRKFCNGIAFKNDSVIYYTTPTTMKYFWEKGATSRYEHPLQSEVITFNK